MTSGIAPIQRVPSHLPRGCPLKIAVIGAGISGLSCAWRLQGGRAAASAAGATVASAPDMHVTVYEANDYLGGHTHTVDATVDGISHPVDTGFLVFNDRTYPRLIALFETLGAPTTASEMTFSVHVDRAGARALEWAGTNLDTVFVQRRNLAHPRFLRMLADLLRFNRAATALARRVPAALQTWTLGEYLAANGYSAVFRDWYLLPMAAAIWSCSTRQMQDFPLATFVRFCDNHGLLQVTDRPQWRTVTGGARTYVERIAGTLPDVRVSTPVLSVARTRVGDRTKVAVRSAAGTTLYDHVVFASHSDQSLALLEDADADQRALLAAVRYQPNRAILHTDVALLPDHPRAWAAWNYRSDAAGRPDGETDGGVSVHYLLNKLQPVPFTRPLVLSLNPAQLPRTETILDAFDYAHPLFDARAIRAQAQLPALQGRDGVWFAGAWTGYGFHEDGLKSGLDVADAMLQIVTEPVLGEVLLAA